MSLQQHTASSLAASNAALQLWVICTRLQMVSGASQQFDLNEGAEHVLLQT